MDRNEDNVETDIEMEEWMSFLLLESAQIQKYSQLAKGFSDFIDVCSRPSNNHPENNITMHIQFI